MARRTGEGNLSAAEAAITDWLALVRAEYLEFPNLHLTKSQVRRLWELDPLTCDLLLSELVKTNFLRRTHEGAYVRASGQEKTAR